MFLEVANEPEYSQQMLDEFEQRYGLESSEFHRLYRNGTVPIRDLFVADQWAFEYEMNIRARESFNFNTGDGHAPGIIQEVDVLGAA